MDLIETVKSHSKTSLPCNILKLYQTSSTFPSDIGAPYFKGLLGTFGYTGVDILLVPQMATTDSEITCLY